MKFLLPTFCCLIVNIVSAADAQRTYDPVMTQALHDLLPSEYRKFPDITRFLVRKKHANPAALLHQATKDDDRTTISMVVQHDRTVVNNIDPKTGRTALQLAKSPQAAQLLLAARADAGVLTDDKTLVQRAVEERKPFGLLHLLCQQKIDMNHKEPLTGNTVAHTLFTLPVSCDLTNIAALLQLAGADFTTPNKQGKTAFNLLKENCSRAQARRIKTDSKRIESFQLQHYSQPHRKNTRYPLMCIITQVLQSKLPHHVIDITTSYVGTLPLGRKTWNLFLQQKHKLRMRG